MFPPAVDKLLVIAIPVSDPHDSVYGQIKDLVDVCVFLATTLAVLGAHTRGGSGTTITRHWHQSLGT